MSSFINFLPSETPQEMMENTEDMETVKDEIEHIFFEARGMDVELADKLHTKALARHNKRGQKQPGHLTNVEQSAAQSANSPLLGALGLSDDDEVSVLGGGWNGSQADGSGAGGGASVRSGSTRRTRTTNKCGGAGGSTYVHPHKAKLQQQEGLPNTKSVVISPIKVWLALSDVLLLQEVSAEMELRGNVAAEEQRLHAYHSMPYAS